jgi:5-methylcytosine-specific restriction endonuclease McrA
MTPEYQAYLDSPEWKAKRRKVLQRAKYRCERCRKAQATQVHHKIYRRDRNGNLAERLKDLQAVCGPCHMKIHGIEDRPKKARLFGRFKRVWARVIG